MEEIRIRINPDTLNKLKTMKEEKKFKSYTSLIDYLIEKEFDTSTENSNGIINTDERLNKILAGVNYNSKLLSLLEEFSNTVTDGLVFNENKNTTSDPSDWYKQAKVEVENKIQMKRTQSLSHSKGDNHE